MSAVFKRGDRGKVRLCLHDEAPRLGSGWRLVLFHIGNKRATLTCAATGRTARIPRATFEHIAQAAAIVGAITFTTEDSPCQ
jgi:hypothetical protein